MRSMADARARLALVGFLSQIGSRMAIRAAAPLAAGVAGWLVLQPDPGAAVRALALALFGPAPEQLGMVGPALVGLAMAGWAAPRVSRGLDGWLPHLPVSGRDLRGSATVALVIAQAPLGLALLGLAVVVGAAGTLPSPVHVLSVPVAMAAAASATSPGGRRWATVPLAGAALLLAGSGSWPDLGIAVLLVLGVELAAGRTVGGRRRAAVHAPATSAIPLRIAVRALGVRTAVAYLVAAAPLAATLLFRANNQLEPWAARGAVRLGAGLAVALLLAALAEPLAVRRPAWPWARSLPWSALQRVGVDALMLAAAALPVLAWAVFVDAWAALPVGGASAFVASRAAGAVRRAAERRTGAAGEVLAEGALLAAWVALVPLLALAAAALVPWALRAAAEREQAQRVSRWLETHHLAAGDSLSWSG